MGGDRKIKCSWFGENSIQRQQWLKVIMRAVIRSPESVKKESVKLLDLERLRDHSVPGWQIHRSCGANFPSCIHSKRC